MAATIHCCSSTKCYDAETDLVYYGLRYCNPSTGRWLSRDPVNEPGLRVVTRRPRRPFYWGEEMNPYAFVGNNPQGGIDVGGLYRASVGKCEVVVLYGHGSADRPHTFTFAKLCSAGHFVGCESAATNDRIPSQNQIPGAPSTDGELYSGRGNRDDPETSFDVFMERSWEAAKKRAKAFCADKTCCCKAVKVKTELAGSWLDPDNWPFPRSRSETVKCDVR